MCALQQNLSAADMATVSQRGAWRHETEYWSVKGQSRRDSASCKSTQTITVITNLRLQRGAHIQQKHVETVTSAGIMKQLLHAGECENISGRDVIVAWRRERRRRLFHPFILLLQPFSLRESGSRSALVKCECGVWCLHKGPHHICTHFPLYITFKLHVHEKLFNCVIVHLTTIIWDDASAQAVFLTLAHVFSCRRRLFLGEQQRKSSRAAFHTIN